MDLFLKAIVSGGRCDELRRLKIFEFFRIAEETFLRG